MTQIIRAETWIGGETLGTEIHEHFSKWKPVGDESDGLEWMPVRGGRLYRARWGTALALAFVPDVPQPTTKKKTKRR
jgi:hypothetical protein